MTEREWREASDMRRSTVLLGIIIAVAAVLRFWGLGAGIPYAVGVDEPEVIGRAVQMLRSGDYNPRFYDYPGLYIYLQMIVAVVRFLAGAVAGEWRSLGEAQMWDFFVWGRAVTATLGTLTVLLVFQIGMRWGTRYALLAAGLMAVEPNHVRESHFILTDVPLTFFVTLTFLLSLRAHEHPRASAFAWAGVAAGLATATKYPGVFALLLPLVAIWMTPATRPSRLAAALVTLAAAGGIFIVAAPYTILDLPGFLDGFARLTAAYGGRPPGAVLYLKYLRINLAWPAFLMAIAGIILALWRCASGPGRVRWALAALLPIVLLWFLSRQSLVYARYLLPMMPFVCVLTATAVVSGVSLLRRFSIPRAVRTALIAGLTIAALLPPAIRAVSFNRTNTQRGTLAHAYEWIDANVPKTANVVIESSQLRLPEHRAANNVPHLRMKTYEQYAADGVEYLIASSMRYGEFFANPRSFPEEYAQYRVLFDQCDELQRFTPAESRPGPEIRILKLRPKTPTAATR